MPKLHNPSATRLFCNRLQRFLDANERIEITAEEAADLKDGAVFVIIADEKRSSPAEETSAAPKRKPAARKTVKRGSKATEVTTAPEPETRG